MKNFFTLLALASVLSVSNQVQASVLYSDPLTAPPLNAGNLVGQDGWTAHDGTANQIQVGGLGATLVQGSGSREDANVAFTPISAGQTYYFGFDVVVTGGNSNAYFAHFKDVTNDFTVRTFVAPSTNGGDFSFGLSPDGSSPTNTWATGLTFTMADCAAAPALYYANQVAPFGDDHPGAARYLDRLIARPSFARVLEEAAPYFDMFPKG